MSFNKNAAAGLLRVAADNPEAEFEALLQKISPVDRELLLAVDFDFCEYWLDKKNSVALTALFYLDGRPGFVAIAVLPGEQFDVCEQNWRSRSGALDDLLRALPVSLCSLDTAIQLLPISIPKPWGREVWYTGIEKRGVAEIGPRGGSVPLPWLLAVAPKRLTGGVQQPILLKILDPLPEPVFGDLYFELHREKQEVYVVTAVDERAWPDGIGAIRFGFDAQQRRKYPDNAAFLQAYLVAVQDYRAVRKQIDEQLDLFRLREGIELDAPVSADTLAGWLSEVSGELQTQEASLRVRMESFTASKPLRVGDVVKVPCLLPHSLQHGVRTVEFQTPVYERLILSFAQKVLTQSEWDTEEAAGVLQLDPDPQASFPLITEGEGWKEEQIVRFDDFEVRRISLQPSARMQFQHDRKYGLGMVVGHALSLGEICLNPDDAVLLPTNFRPVALHNDGAESAYFLLALPLF